MARHLNHAYARGHAAPALIEALDRWIVRNPTTTVTGGAGWPICDAIGTTATASDLDAVLRIATDRRFGRSRQMLVFAIWRFKKDPRIVPTLLNLIEDNDVSQHAMSSLRRAVGNAAAIPLLTTLIEGQTDPAVREQARKALRKAERAATVPKTKFGFTTAIDAQTVT